MAKISLSEDMLGYTTSDVFIPNVIVCGAVAVRLTTGFIGMHFTPGTTVDEMTVAANYAATTFVPLGKPVVDLVFFVTIKDFGANRVKSVTDILTKAFGKAPRIVEKPPSVAKLPSVDLWLHKPTTASPKANSWIGVRPHMPGVSPVTPLNDRVMKIRIGKPPTIVRAPIQTLPTNQNDGWQSIQ